LKEEECMLSRLAVVVYLMVAWPGLSFAIPEAPAVGEVWVSVGACPFEGCSYGKWPVQKATPVRREPKLSTPIVATLQQGEQIDALRGDVHVFPGRARVVDQPHNSAAGLDPEEDILILDYIGEGRSRVYQTGHFAQVMIARTKERCQSNPNWRHCWVEVLLEPVCNWWVEIEARDGQIKGWLLVDKGNVRPTDEFE
jgi:hypothetical protein